jgi:hypothetical protein
MMVILTITLFVSIKTSDRAFGFLTMMIIWLFISFVIPQLAETQRNFAMSLNTTSQAVTTVATDTVASRIIEYFSPAAQFESIGENCCRQYPTQLTSAYGVLFLNRQSPLFACWCRESCFCLHRIGQYKRRAMIRFVNKRLKALMVGLSSTLRNVKRF